MGKEAMGNRSDFDIITSKKSLLNDFPIISEVMEEIDREDYVQNIVFQWCIYHLIPSEHLKKSDAHALYYENLLTDLDNELVKLFHYLDKPFDMQELKDRTGKASSTNFLERNFSQDNTQNSWKEEFSASQIQKADSILAAFGLDDLYDNNGLPTGAEIFKN